MKFRSSLDKYRRGKPNKSGSKYATVNIESLTLQGEGVAHIEGQVVFVAHTAPGDKVKIRIVEKHKRWLRANVVELVQASTQRCEPKCSYVPRCGGCNWQHLKYEYQLSAKETQLVKTIQHVGNFDSITVRPIVASPRQFAYRNRIRGVLQNNQFHFHASGSNDLVAIEHCAIADESINDSLVNLQNDPDEPQQYIEIATSEDEIKIYPISADRTTTLGFRQVNDEVSNQLTNAVTNVISTHVLNRPNFPVALLDLYCGHGSWSLQIAKAHPNLNITGVDLLADNIKTAQRLAKGTKNVSFIAQSAEHALSEQKSQVDVCIVDPPRAGLSTDVVTALNKFPVKTLVYVSCHPASLARDLAALNEAAYSIDFVQPYDMFPQTAHVETLAVLHKR